MLGRAQYSRRGSGSNPLSPKPGLRHRNRHLAFPARRKTGGTAGRGTRSHHTCHLSGGDPWDAAFCFG
jgi:hypothetical protein